MDFTYGPLGFLAQEILFYGSTAALAMAYAFFLAIATFTLLIHWSRRSFGLPIAIVLSYVVGATVIAMVDLGDLMMAPATLLAVLCIHRTDVKRRQIGIAILGAAGGVALLVKFSDGVVALVVLVAAVLAGREHRVREAVIASGSYLGAVLLGWLATGNPIDQFPTFMRYSASVASGYSTAMQIETGRTEEWWFALVGGSALVVAAILSLWPIRGRVKIAATIVLVVVFWWALKEGFVRHDAHDLILFGYLPLLLISLPLPRVSMRPFLVSFLALLTVIAWSALGDVPSNLLSFIRDGHNFASEALTIMSPDRRTAAIDSARQQMRESYGLTSEQVALVKGHTLAIQPWENSVAWAYPASIWDPEPVLQAYSAYTPALDQLDANFLSSSSAPTRILQEASAVLDYRYYFFEPPTTWVTMMCRYIQMDATPSWQVLERVPYRCGTIHLIDQVSAAFGQRVKVPRAPNGDVVLASFGNVPLPFWYEIAAVTLKPPTMWISTSVGKFRFVEATAGDLHVVRPTSTLDYSAPYDPGTMSWLSLTGAGVPTGTGTYDVRFYEMRVRLR